MTADKVFKTLFRHVRAKLQKKGVSVSGVGAPTSWALSSLPAGKRQAFFNRVDLAARTFFKDVVKEVGSYG